MHHFADSKRRTSSEPPMGVDSFLPFVGSGQFPSPGLGIVVGCVHTRRQYAIVLDS